MTKQGGNCLRRSRVFADPSCRQLADRYPRQRTRSMGAFFCILFCGMTKEYGGVRGRDPATLVLMLMLILNNRAVHEPPLPCRIQPIRNLVGRTDLPGWTDIAHLTTQIKVELIANDPANPGDQLENVGRRRPTKIDNKIGMLP